MGSRQALLELQGQYHLLHFSVWAPATLNLSCTTIHRHSGGFNKAGFRRLDRRDSPKRIWLCCWVVPAMRLHHSCFNVSIDASSGALLAALPWPLLIRPCVDDGMSDVQGDSGCDSDWPATLTLTCPVEHLQVRVTSESTSQGGASGAEHLWWSSSTSQVVGSVLYTRARDLLKVTGC